MEGAADSDMKEDSESKEDYTNNITQYSYIVSLTSILMKEQQNIQMLSHNDGHPFWPTRAWINAYALACKLPL